MWIRDILNGHLLGRITLLSCNLRVDNRRHRYLESILPIMLELCPLTSYHSIRAPHLPVRAVLVPHRHPLLQAHLNCFNLFLLIQTNHYLSSEAVLYYQLTADPHGCWLVTIRKNCCMLRFLYVKVSIKLDLFPLPLNQNYPRYPAYQCRNGSQINYHYHACYLRGMLTTLMFRNQLTNLMLVLN